MPFAPAVQYRGDQYLFQGISNLGNIVSDDLKKYLELKKQGDMNDAIINHAAQTGMIKPDEYNNYVQANWGKKQGIANGIIANIHDDWQRSMFNQEQQQKQAALQNQITLEGMRAGSAEKIAQMGIDAGKYAGQGGDEPIKIDPVYDPTDPERKAIPGMGMNRKTGQMIQTSTEVPDVILSPDKKFLWKGQKQGWQPLQSKLARQLGDATTGDLPAPPVLPPNSVMHPSTWTWNTPTPSPTPAIAQPDIPAAQGVAPGPAYPAPAATPGAVGAAPAAPVAQVDAATARAQAQAKINAGANRDAVIARLKQLGVDSSGL